MRAAPLWRHTSILGRALIEAPLRTARVQDEPAALRRSNQPAAANQLDEAGKCLFAAHSDYAMGATSQAPNASYALQRHFPVTEHVASLAMVCRSRLVAPS